MQVYAIAVMFLSALALAVPADEPQCRNAGSTRCGFFLCCPAGKVCGKAAPGISAGSSAFSCADP
ncbi:hypothetical protein HIM_01511 [Hirsutella minnesotensis 3608]|nr:hypothetical protein HIM_01511 [Hirsutella minnesotensis 3608]